MISEWAKFQEHMEIPSPQEEACLPRAIGPQKDRFFFPWANLKVRFPYLKPTAHSEIVGVNQVIKGIETFQWPSHLLIQEYILLHEVYLLK